MKIILCEDIIKLGTAGEIKDVKNGYARNFLFPKNLALVATPANLKKWESQKKIRDLRLNQTLESARSLAGQLENLSIHLSLRAGQQGHLFGSVTNQMISEALLTKGFTVDKKNIEIESPIKTLGEHSVTLKLHPQVSVTLKVEVASSETSESSPSKAAS